MSVAATPDVRIILEPITAVCTVARNGPDRYKIGSNIAVNGHDLLGSWQPAKIHARTLHFDLFKDAS